MAEEDSEEELRRKEECAAAGVAKIQAGLELLLERQKLDRELDRWLRSELQSYLDAEGIEGRRSALGTIREILKDDTEGSDSQLQADLREWLSQLGFAFVGDTSTLCGIPDDETLAWRLAHAPELRDVWPLACAEDPRYAKQAAEANVDWFCEDPNELRRISEALQIEETERFLGDVRRAIELEEKPEARRRFQRLAEDLERRIETLQDESSAGEKVEV